MSVIVMTMLAVMIMIVVIMLGMDLMIVMIVAVGGAHGWECAIPAPPRQVKYSML